MKRKVEVFITTLAVVAVAVLIGSNTVQEETRETEEQEPSRKEVEMKAPDPVTEKINEMDLDEKIGQLFISGIDGTEINRDTAAMIEEKALGGIILFQPNLEEPEESVALVNDLLQMDHVQDVPLFISVDQEGGLVERLPGLKPLKTAAEVGEYDKAFAYENGALLARLVKGFGMQLNFAPVLDIDSNPDNPVIGDRAYGSDAKKVSEAGISVMQGMQDEGVMTAVKHFPGHGDTTEDSHEELPVVNKTREELNDNELIPFKKAVETGADMVLLSHIKLPKLGIDQPASFSEAAVDILRKNWDYDGIIITDDLTMGAIVDHYPMEEVTVDAVKAGVDILMIAHEQELLLEGISGVKTAVESGEISETRIDESVRRILELKETYDLNNKPVESISIEALNADIDDVYNGT